MPGERRSIDLNADVGEATDDAGVAIERALLGLVTSAHIACGGHAGDEESMRATVQAALDAGVRVGAHPSYPDRAGFGRRPMEMAASDLASSLAAQIGALVAVAASLGTDRLFGEAARRALRRGGRATRPPSMRWPGCSPTCAGPTPRWCSPRARPRSSWAHRAGVLGLEEGFADRAYMRGRRP